MAQARCKLGTWRGTGKALVQGVGEVLAKQSKLAKYWRKALARGWPGTGKALARRWGMLRNWLPRHLPG